MKDIFKVKRKHREGSLSLTIIFLKFICFPNLVSNYTFKWLCSVSVERTTQASNWCLSLLLSHSCVVSLILLRTVPCVPELHTVWGKEFGLKSSMSLSFLFWKEHFFSSETKKKDEKKNLCQLYHACSLLKASAEICLDYSLPSLLSYITVFIVSMDLRFWIVNVKNYLKLIFSLFRNIYPPAMLVFSQFLSSSRLHVIAYWPHVFASMWCVLINIS